MVPASAMYPVVFGFLPSFGLLVATGFLVGVWLWGRLLATHGLDPKEDPQRASDVAIWLLVGVIGGGRLMYVAVETTRYLGAERSEAMEAYLDGDAARATELSDAEWDTVQHITVGHAFLNDPLKLFFVWEGGLVMFGGMAGAMILGAWAARRRSLNPWNGLDTGLTAGFVGQAIGRWGCLLVGDDYGRVVPEGSEGLPFPIAIRVPSAEWLQANPKSLFDRDLAGEVLWATQIWMSLNALIVAGVAYLVLRRRRHLGTVTGVLLIHYSISRAVIEMFRGDEVRGVWFGGTVSTSQLVAVVGVLVGIAILVTARRRPLPPPVSP